MTEDNLRSDATEIVRKVMLSQLIQAQAMEVLLADLAPAVASMPKGAELGALLEDIGNAYLDLAEGIANRRATHAVAG